MHESINSHYPADNANIRHPNFALAGSLKSKYQYHFQPEGKNQF